MPNFQAPGVYVLEVPGTPPIAGVGTSTAAFIGVVDDSTDDFTMPLKPGSETERFTLIDADIPKQVANFDQFKNYFGNFQEGNKTLSHAVFGFFLNSGSKCWVVRVDNIDSVQDALAEIARIDEVAIVAAPGARSQAAQDAMINHCELLQDRFAVLDGQETETITPAAIQGSVKDSNYAALYFPAIEVTNQTLAPVNTGDAIELWKPTPGARLDMPTSAHISGIYARVDNNRGVHKAPANEVVRGALALKYLTTRSEQEGLNPDGINVIRGFDGNLKVWGARTLGGDDNGEFKYINVRRLFNFMRESIDEGTQFAVFEPNSPPLWAKIRRAVTAFLTNIWRDGALFGNSPGEAFYVRCDETTNPPEVRDLGQVITEIGVAVVKPAEFVIFRISQVTSGSF